MDTRKATDVLGGFAKGLAVIEAFSAENPRLSISDVAAATGFDRATARRCLLTLNELGYASYDGKYFMLLPRVLRLGTSCLAAMPLPRIVQPLLDRLSADIGQSTSVSILDDWEIVYVARAARQSLMSVNLMPGSRLPAFCTSMGRVLLGGLTEPKLRSLFKRHPPRRRTEWTMVDSDELIARLALTRDQGFAIVNQEVEIGLRSIAIPLHDARGRVVAAMNVGVAAMREDPREMHALYFAKMQQVQQALRPLLV